MCATSLKERAIILLSLIIAGLATWFAAAAVVAVIIGRMVARRDEVCQQWSSFVPTPDRVDAMAADLTRG